MTERPPLDERFVEYASRIQKLYGALPKGHDARIIGDQMLRSGLSVGAHFNEGVHSRSANEYKAKLNAGLMELEETIYWLKIIRKSNFFSERRLEPIIDESQQLAAILTSLLKKHEKKPPSADSPDI